MQPSRTSDNSSGRKLSGPGTWSTQWTAEATTSNPAPKAATVVSTTQPPVTRATSGSSSQHQTVSASSVHKAPMVLTPVSQISRGPRRISRHEPPTGDQPSSHDPELYNPDGSLRTVYKLPSFDQSYADARNTRYIRHKERTESETELSVDQIFEKHDYS
ncbi:hypothetical protein BsWGS_09061 [Bradybaena similaris]